MSVIQMIYHDKTFDLKEPVMLNMDVSLATISKDSGLVPLSELQKGNEITALSFSEQFKNIILKDSNDYREIFEKIPNPAPVDEIKIIDAQNEKQPVKKGTRKEHVSLSRIVWTGLAVIIFLILLIFSLPWLIFKWLNFKANHTKVVTQKAYWSYIAATYYLNQLGFSRGQKSPAEFAKEKIDPEFKTNFTSFMQVYLKSKYSKEALNASEEMIAQNFYHPFYQTVKEKISFKERFSKFLNFYRTINFFSKPKLYKNGNSEY
jgi:hypothetical protein